MDLTFPKAHGASRVEREAKGRVCSVPSTPSSRKSSWVPLTSKHPQPSLPASEEPYATVWPITLPEPSGSRDLFRNGHVTPPHPMRVSPGIFAATPGK